jgi:hypothetical protein
VSLPKVHASRLLRRLSQVCVGGVFLSQPPQGQLSYVIYVALLTNGIGPGDEVIATPFTFIASAISNLDTGARPVFVDIDPDTLPVHPALTLQDPETNVRG